MTEFWEAKYKALRAAFIAWRHIERQDAKVQIKQLQRYQSLVYKIKTTESDYERWEAIGKLWDDLKEHIAERHG